jgi:hypothetical protein
MWCYSGFHLQSELDFRLGAVLVYRGYTLLKHDIVIQELQTARGRQDEDTPTATEIPNQCGNLDKYVILPGTERICVFLYCVAVAPEVVLNLSRCLNFPGKYKFICGYNNSLTDSGD